MRITGCLPIGASIRILQFGEAVPVTLDKKTKKLYFPLTRSFRIRKAIMKAKTGRFYRTVVMVLSLVFLVGICSSAAAGQGRHAWKVSEKSKPASNDAAAVAPPAPVTDDTPIDPDAHVRGKVSDTSGNHQSAKASEKGKARRDR